MPLRVLVLLSPVAMLLWYGCSIWGSWSASPRLLIAWAIVASWHCVVLAKNLHLTASSYQTDQYAAAAEEQGSLVIVFDFWSLHAWRRPRLPLLCWQNLLGQEVFENYAGLDVPTQTKLVWQCRLLVGVVIVVAAAMILYYRLQQRISL